MTHVLGTQTLWSQILRFAARLIVARLKACGLRWFAELLRAVHPPIAWRLLLQTHNYVALASSLSRPLLKTSPTSGQLLGAFTWAGLPSFVRIAQSRHLAWAPDRKQVFV